MERTIQYLFEDLLVVDAATFLAGPGAATVLGDFGARVIKIEPQDGDRYRTLKGTWPIDYNWLLTSRNKESIAIDLRKAEGRQIVHDLVAKADVFLTNFIGDQLYRYEYEYERLARINPRLIYAHITGYGTKGEDIEKRSFDATAWWARTGLMDFVRGKGSSPVSSAPGMGDHATSMSVFSAIVTALYRREKTGEGAYVTTSLVANGVWANGMSLQGVIAGADLATRRQTSGLNNPFNNVYRTRDDRFILFTIINAEREWPQLAKALNHEEWLNDERFQSVASIIANRFEVIQLLEEAISALDLEDALRRLEEYEVTHSYVMPNKEVIDDPQLSVNEIIVKTADESADYQKTIMSPIQIEGEAKRVPQRAPEIGENSIPILSELLHLDQEEIATLIELNIVKTNDPIQK